MQRLLAAAWLAKGKTTLYNPGKSADDLAALKIIQEFGVKVTEGEDYILLDASEFRKPTSVFAGESGLSSRMFSVLISSLDYPITMQGEGTLLQRDFSPLREIFDAGKVEFTAHNNQLPITINGPIQPGTYYLDGSQSSQFITGLLMILPTLTGDSVVVVKNLKSIGYLAITLDVMKSFGVHIDRNEAFSEFTIRGNQRYLPTKVEVEADWSGGAFLLVAAALLKNMTVSGLSLNSVQPDILILEALQKVGYDALNTEHEIGFEEAQGKVLTLDLTHAPDLFPPAVLLCLFTHGHHRIKGVHRLPGKESDRGNVMIQELSKSGQSLWIENDELHIKGQSPWKEATLNPHGDHRMAMLFALAGKVSGVKLEVLDPQCVSKSFPNFWEVLDKM